MKFADLHTHTTFSDGTTTPEKIVILAEKHNLCALAICDHDTVDGVLPALSAAENTTIEVIPSLELSSENNNYEVHILGFLLDYENPVLACRLKEIRDVRLRRMREMVDRLRVMDVDIDIKEVFKLAGNAAVGRVHLARVLKARGYISTLQEAFYKYIGENCPAYVSKFKLTSKEAIQLILDAKGVPVLAHPYSLNNDSLIREFVGFGLLGIEAYYPEHQASFVKHYENIADKFNLIKTGGSDYHGSIKPQNPLGKIKVPYDIVTQLKDAKKKINS